MNCALNQLAFLRWVCGCVVVVVVVVVCGGVGEWSVEEEGESATISGRVVGGVREGQRGMRNEERGEGNRWGML